MYFAGGMSTQFFLPKNLHRPSSDIDMNGIPKYSLTEFQNAISGGIEELLNKGYKTSKKKQRYTYDINLDSGNEKVILQYPRKSTSSYNWLKKVTGRENANAQKIKYNGGNIRLIPTEDIILHKILRSNSFLKQGLKKPKNKELHQLQDSIENLKEDLMLNQFNMNGTDLQKTISKIRLYADIFDINALTIYKKLDKKYFLESLKDYDNLIRLENQIIENLYKINPNVFGGE